MLKLMMAGRKITAAADEVMHRKRPGPHCESVLSLEVKSVKDVADRSVSIVAVQVIHQLGLTRDALQARTL